MNFDEIKDLLDSKVDQYNRPEFIEDDPISIPHQYSLKQDIEISGFFAAILAWGQRKTIINKSNDLLKRMDHAPFDFVLNHTENDLKSLLSFKHRTFNATDTLYFIHVLKHHYLEFDTLEKAFVKKKGLTTEQALIDFHDSFFAHPEFPGRTRKHIATPARNSTCKRLNMFLRWMARSDNRGVDFGIWNNIAPSQLICPCDVHVDRIARHLGLISRKQTDWKTAVELTQNLIRFDPKDPVKYDFALFGIGVMEKI